MIEGARVLLRLPDGAGDHRKLVDWRNDAELKQWFYDDEPVSMEGHLCWWAGVRTDPSQRFYMIEANGEAIGCLGLLNIDWRNRTAEYGRLKIGNPNFRGKGYAFEAEVLLMRHAFDSLNLNRIWGHVLDNNARVLALHEKVGFVQEGCLQQHIYKHGRYYNVVTIGLLAETFRGLYPT